MDQALEQRGGIVAAIVGFTVVLGGLLWFLIAFSRPPRADHAPGGGEDLAALATEVRTLRAELAGRGGPGVPGAPFQTEPGVVPVRRVAVGALPIDDPFAEAWTDGAPVVVTLEAQQTAMPMLDRATVPSVRVRALTDGRWIAWHCAWDDDDADWQVDTDRFCDSVAVQFPLVPNAAFTMGDHGLAVQILQWKALWQRDIDEHFQDVQDLHPNYWTDLYWFADRDVPVRVPDDFSRPEALDYFVAYRAGNPVSEIRREQPVQELLAEGFGTSTYQPATACVSRGAWRDGAWSVVFARPMVTRDPGDFQFEPGVESLVAFAVWDGAAENVGGRKHHSQWVAFEVQP